MVNKSNKKKAVLVSTGAVGTGSIGASPSLAAGSSSNSNNSSNSASTGTAGSGGTSTSTSSPGNIAGSGTKAKKGLRTEITSLVNGFGTQFPDASSTISVSGQATSVSDLLAALAAALGFFAAVDAAVQALKTQRLALTAEQPSARKLVASIKAALISTFGKGNPVLVAFGFSAVKPRVLTTAQKLAKSERAKATRELRGTTGPREKLGTKFIGTVQVQTSLSGNQAASGNAPATGSNTAGASTTPNGSNTAVSGSTPAVSGTPAAGSGNTGT
jgi:hypothetical protein